MNAFGGDDPVGDAADVQLRDILDHVTLKNHLYWALNLTDLGTAKPTDLQFLVLDRLPGMKECDAAVLVKEVDSFEHKLWIKGLAKDDVLYGEPTSDDLTANYPRQMKVVALTRLDASCETVLLIQRITGHCIITVIKINELAADCAETTSVTNIAGTTVSTSDVVEAVNKKAPRKWPMGSSKCWTRGISLVSLAYVITIVVWHCACYYLEAASSDES